jgi:hypothetical protein
MSEVLQTNVFFFIASVAVVAFTILLCIVLYQIIKILGSVRQIAKRVEEGSEMVVENISNVRKYLTETPFLRSIVSGLFGIHSYEEKKAQRPRRKKAKSEEAIDKD